jgi:hypothetical protein
MITGIFKMTKKECDKLNYGALVEANGKLFRFKYLFKFLGHGTLAVVAGAEQDHVINRKLLKLQVKSD